MKAQYKNWIKKERKNNMLLLTLFGTISGLVVGFLFGVDYTRKNETERIRTKIMEANLDLVDQDIIHNFFQEL